MWWRKFNLVSIEIHSGHPAASRHVQAKITTLATTATDIVSNTHRVAQLVQALRHSVDILAVENDGLGHAAFLCGHKFDQGLIVAGGVESDRNVIHPVLVHKEQVEE